MIDQPDLVVLARVVDRGSFAAAAAELGVPPSTLSRRVAALEERLGVRALERTTRRLRPTEIGETLAAHGRRVHLELEDAERAVADHRSSPRGVLRIAIPTAMSDLLAPVFANLLTRHSEVRLELGVTDAPLGFLANGFDAALHGGAIPDSSYGVLRLGHIAPVLVASPSYLAKAPPLRHPRDLAEHAIVARTRKPKWRFVHKSGAALSVSLSPRAIALEKSSGAELIAAGVGIGIVPRASLFAHRELRALEPAGYRPPGGPFSLVTPSARAATPKVQAFTAAMKSYIASRRDVFG